MVFCPLYVMASALWSNYQISTYVIMLGWPHVLAADRFSFVLEHDFWPLPPHVLSVSLTYVLNKPLKKKNLAFHCKPPTNISLGSCLYSSLVKWHSALIMTTADPISSTVKEGNNTEGIKAVLTWFSYFLWSLTQLDFKSFHNLLQQKETWMSYFMETLQIPLMKGRTGSLLRKYCD